jgi:hypothetical protein
MTVYLVGAANSALVKIGHSRTPEQRLTDLQAGSPLRLSLLATWPGGQEMEARLHIWFVDERRHGEWFDLGSAPVERVDAAQAQIRQSEQRLPAVPLTQAHVDWFPDDPPAVPTHPKLARVLVRAGEGG